MALDYNNIFLSMFDCKHVECATPIEDGSQYFFVVLIKS